MEELSSAFARDRKLGIQRGDASSSATLGSYPVLVSALGDEPLIGCGVAKHFTITLDHAERVIVES